jgi:hypothetical protein
MPVQTKLTALAVGASMAVASAALATPVVIQPNEAASKDTFVYSAIPSGLPFGNATYLGASLETSGVHTVNSMVQFDLTGVSLAAGETAKFSIASRSKAATPFSSVASDPSATSPVTIDVYAVTSAWDEATVTYSNQPTVAASPFASFVVNGIGNVYSVDVTSLLASWLATPATNFGVEVRQHAIVTVPSAPDAAVVFDSAGGTIAPSLTVVAAPEPATLASLAGLSMLFARRRR